MSRRRPVLGAAAVLSLAAGLGLPALGDGAQPPVLRSAFVPNVTMTALATSPTAPVKTPSRPIDGRLAGWDVGVDAPGLEGTTVVQAGELVYEGYLLGDSGAISPCRYDYYQQLQPVADASGWPRYQAIQSALGAELIGDVDEAGLFDDRPLSCDKGAENFGEVRYPAGATQGSADIVQLRVAATKDRVSLLALVDAMTDADQPVVTFGIDTDGDTKTGKGDWGFGSGVATPGADHVLTLTRAGAYLDGQPAPGAQVASRAGEPDGFGGVLVASLPRRDFGSTSTWRMWAGAGVWDKAKSEWAKPVAEDPGPRVLDLGFRSGAEPFSPYMNMGQAFALRSGWDGKVSTIGPEFTQQVDLDALAHGQNQKWRITPGYYIRDVMTSVRDGESHGHVPGAGGTPQSEGISARQPYGMYVPTSYDVDDASPMTVWLHWRGPGMENAAYYDPNMTWQLGEQRDNIVISPRGRGESDWYVGGSQTDVFDAMGDAEHLLNVDRNRVYVAGYSMGGWGTYVMAGLHPDLFAGGFSIVGPPALGLWPYPADPTDPQNDRPLYWTNPLVGNFRHMPFVVFEGTDDELVPFTGPMAQTNTMLANTQPFRFYLYDGYEHFTFAITDEWSLGADYLGGARRVTHPARVTYTRLPCLDPTMWNPDYGHAATGAYWVNEIELRDGPAPKNCTNPDAALDDVNVTGSVDITSEAIRRLTDIGHPVAGSGPAPDETGSYQMTGYDPEPGTPLPLANTLDVTLTNVSSVVVSGVGARLSDTEPLVLKVSSDGAARIHLTGLPGLAKDTVQVDKGTSTITIQPAAA